MIGEITGAGFGPEVGGGGQSSGGGISNRSRKIKVFYGPVVGGGGGGFSRNGQNKSGAINK